MKNIFSHIFINISLLFIISCSNYIDKMHHQIDVENDRDSKFSSKNFDKFDIYRKKGSRDILNQDSINSSLNENENNVSSRIIKKNLPSIKRQYGQYKKQRYQADDLIDNSAEGSLWSGSGQENFLFAKNSYKNPGDIILVKVLDKLKKEISLELARAFPGEKRKDEKSEVKDEAKDKANENANTTGTKEEGNSEIKVYDNISSVVIEELNKDHLIIRGRKDILFKSRKRIIELQALISRRDIGDDDSILSSNILETNILVLR